MIVVLSMLSGWLCYLVEIGRLLSFIASLCYFPFEHLQPSYYININIYRYV